MRLSDAAWGLLEDVVLGLLRVSWRVVRSPVLLALVVFIVVVSGGSWFLAGGPWGVGVAWGLVVVVLFSWWFRWRFGFRRFFGPVRRGVRAWWVYRRRWDWVAAACSLGVRAPVPGGGKVLGLPVILDVVIGVYRDVVVVGMGGGRGKLGAYVAAGEDLANRFGALACRVRDGGPGVVELGFLVSDPLVSVVPALDPPVVPDLRDVVIGVTEDGLPWGVPLLGHNVLVVGMPGAGKGSVIWGLLRGVAYGVRGGLVQVWGVDPKGGMELGIGRELFLRFAADDLAATHALLKDLAAVMRERSRRLAAQRSRLHVPTERDPFIMLIIDEIATLTAYQGSNPTSKRVAELMGLIMTQGRAVGITIVAAIQDPRVEVLKFRDLFSYRIALRLGAANQVNMVLGEEARELGARADDPRLVPRSMPGVGFVRREDVREPVRVRAAYVTDQEILEMALAFQPSAEVREAWREFRRGLGSGGDVVVGGVAQAELREIAAGLEASLGEGSGEGS